MNAGLHSDFANAAWPVLLVDDGGVIQRANPAALQAFGPSLLPERTKLPALWLPDNCISVEKFLNAGESALPPLTPLKMQLPGGPKVFSALASRQSGEEIGRAHV